MFFFCLNFRNIMVKIFAINAIEVCKLKSTTNRQLRCGRNKTRFMIDDFQFKRDFETSFAIRNVGGT